MLERLEPLFLLARPYSWVDLAGIALVAQLLFGAFNALALLGVLFAWIAFCFHLEWRHKHHYRMKVSLVPIIVFSFLAIVLFAYLRGFETVIPLAAAIILGAVYPFKKLSPLTVGLFKAVLVFLAAPLSPLLFLAGVFFWHAGRNLVGDIRDKDFDKFSPAKMLGSFSSLLSLALMLVGLLLFSLYGQLVLVVGVLVVLAFAAHYFLQHSLLVLASVLLVFLFLPNAVGLILFIAGAIVLRLTYLRVPRPSNKLALKEWRKLVALITD